MLDVICFLDCCRDVYTVHCGIVFIAFWMLDLDCSTVNVHVHVFLQLKYRVLTSTKWYIELHC